MHYQYTGRKLMIRFFTILIILNLSLFRLGPVSSPQPEAPLFSSERISAFWEAMVQAGWEEEKLELSAVPPVTEETSFSSQDYELVFPPRRVEPVPLPPQVRGVYVTGWTAGLPARFSALLELAEKTCINSLVIDIKDDTGLVSYYSNLPAVRKLGAWAEKIRDPEKMLATLKQRGIYPIARLVLFKDPVLARKRPDLAVQNINGGVWLDNKGIAWVDPNSREVWEYNIAIAKEAAAMGFPEIQFDYVRFPSDGRLENAFYPHGGEKTKPEVIEDFLRYAREQLEPLGVLVSVDLFGLVCSDPGHIGIGQNLEGIAGAVDILSPMVYPSHYYPGTYGLADPDRQPYATVYRSLADAQERLARGGEVVCGARLRPWLQAFSINARYGRKEILAQIKAARAAGVDEWLFWNAGSRYNPAHYPDEEELAALATVPPGLLREEETLTEEPGVGEPLTEGELTEEPPTGEEPMEEPAKGPVARESLVEEELAEEPVAQDRPAEEEPAEERVTDEPLAEEAESEGPVTEEPATEEPLTEEPMTGESLIGEPVTEETAREDSAVEDQATEGFFADPAAGEEAAGTPAPEEGIAEEPPAAEPEAAGGSP
ncbi:MAG: hypothetical protein GX085_09900 [Firmicutes bacterium]|nr:hypothetical protein [Bacillota bacterium]